MGNRIKQLSGCSYLSISRYPISKKSIPIHTHNCTEEKWYTLLGGTFLFTGLRVVIRINLTNGVRTLNYKDDGKFVKRQDIICIRLGTVG